MDKKIKYDLDINEILVIPTTDSDSLLSLNTNLYNIESSNTKVALISATEFPIDNATKDVSTDVQKRYYIQKTSPESEIVTVVSTGTITLSTTKRIGLGEEIKELVRISLNSNAESDN
ncbi:hypothetical protein [Oceanirhabdus sp. W0125-5]|uniref:hypothetical protein n=1 Tax=Oceanirhabdus sp. W0125-5 TaxID=2999116 RepID=UPI0022F341C0|nr:hypothetical protein [Oceanirhabdus sp. W0125-5]WBW96766.1 hypothetical protein OW730_24200 [Oceanirhabdus sp. W0125-5]